MCLRCVGSYAEFGLESTCPSLFVTLAGFEEASSPTPDPSAPDLIQQSSESSIRISDVQTAVEAVNLPLLSPGQGASHINNAVTGVFHEQKRDSPKHNGSINRYNNTIVTTAGGYEIEIEGSSRAGRPQQDTAAASQTAGPSKPQGKQGSKLYCYLQRC